MLCPWSGPFHATIMALLIITFKSGDLFAGYKMAADQDCHKFGHIHWLVVAEHTRRF